MTGPPPPRPALSALPTYKPGRSAEVAMRDHALDMAYKLASNENPYDPLPSVRAAIADASMLANRYPDHLALAVRDALAERLGVTPAWIAVGCGSVGLLQQLLLAFADPGEEVLYAWRSFEAYPIYSAIAGATSISVPLRFEGLDMAALTKAVTDRTRLVLLTSPNNPTGTAITHQELEALLAVVPERCLVVLDEAYHEYITGLQAPDALALLRAHPNLAVLRTFSKAYGLAGLRIGYLLSHPRVVAATDQALIPFAVNGLAQAAALASLQAEAELQERVTATLAERHRVQTALRRLGFSTPDTQANFLWLPAGAASAALTLKLETLGVVTRPFPDEGIRVTIGRPEEDDRFLDAFEAAAAPLELVAHWRLPTGEQARIVQSWIDRIDAADGRLLVHGATPHRGLTEPDPGGTERWDAPRVWAHLAEFGRYWQAELAKVVDAASAEPVPFGRVKTDPGRVAAIEDGRHRPVEQNLLTARSRPPRAAGLPRRARHRGLGTRSATIQRSARCRWSASSASSTSVTSSNTWTNSTGWRREPAIECFRHGPVRGAAPVSRSWVEVPDGSDFTFANLAYGVIRPIGMPPLCGVRIGDHVLDLAAVQQLGLLDGTGLLGSELSEPTLNGLLAAGPTVWSAVRGRLVELLGESSHWRHVLARHLYPVAQVKELLPFDVADYVDFYSSEHHARNMGLILRPDGEPLLANWKHLPVGYHGRSGTVVVSGAPVRRPQGLLGTMGKVPTFAPTAALDIELEVGAVIGGPPGATNIPVDGADEHVFGFVLLNDWSSARHPGVRVPAARAVPRQELRHLHLGLGRAPRRADRVLGARARSGSAAGGLPPRAAAVGARRPPRGRAEWNNRESHQSSTALLDVRAAARPRHRQRSHHPPWRPSGVGHGERVGPRFVRQLDGAHVARPRSAVPPRRRPEDLPRGRRPGRAAWLVWRGRVAGGFRRVCWHDRSRTGGVTCPTTARWATSPVSATCSLGSPTGATTWKS